MPEPSDLQRLLIFGAGGFGREVLDVVEAANAIESTWQFVGFVDDAPSHLDRLSARGAALLAGLDDPGASGAQYVIGIGDPGVRRLVAERALAAGLSPARVVHPTAAFGGGNDIGEGFVCCANVSVTTGVSIGRHVHLNLNSTVGHDCTLGDFVTVYPGAHISGDVTLHDSVSVGSGAVILQGVTVGAGTFVGAGSVVTKDLPEGVVAVGSPARAIHRVS